MMNNFPIVVAYDGSAAARAALRWALDDAVGRGAPLRLVYVVEPPVTTGLIFPMPFDYSDEAHRMQAQSLLADAAAEAAVRQPTVDVSSEMRQGPVVATLCKLSGDARLVVLGRRGPGGLTGLFVGSASVAVAAHAHCPVVVVREGDPDQRHGQPVVVGVDDSAQARLAAAFAFEEAAVRGVDLVAVRAWSPPSPPWRTDVRPLVWDAAELEAAERQMLVGAIEDLAAEHSSVAMTSRLVAGDARHALAEASAKAQLMVVGSRGRGGFAGLVLGSVSHYLLHHAQCPVAVIPHGLGQRA